MENTNWLDKNEYPFKANYLPLEAGPLHYLDEGTGYPIVLVHGTPVWSFLYRNLVKELSKKYRCIVPDHIGFGLSAKPENWSYTPEAHSQNLSKLLDNLQLRNITLVVHDFGGPIGLNYALQHPDNIDKLVVLNSWLWSLAEVKPMVQASKLFGGPIGKFLYKYFNFSTKVLLPKAFYDRQKLTRAVHQHYLKVLPTPVSRTGTWRLAQELTASGTWFQNLWEQKNGLQDKPVLLIWGVKDAFIPEAFLQKWQQAFPKAKVIKLESGHFVPEEKPQEVLKAIQEFMQPG